MFKNVRERVLFEEYGLQVTTQERLLGGGVDTLWQIQTHPRFLTEGYQVYKCFL